MNYTQILETLTEHPLILTPSSHASLMRIFEEHRSGEKTAREGEGFCGEVIELEQAGMDENGIMHIPVNGPIGRGLGKFEKGAGAVDVGDIESELDTAEEDTACRGVIFHFDSPGGMYSGTPELADRIMRCEKTTVAFIPGLACSGGYWLASACDIVTATKSADVANVGVYCYLLDQSARYAAAGVKPILVSSGDYKGMGVPGIPFSKAQLAHLQDRVNTMADTFYSHVETVRPDVARADMQGQCWKAPDALAKGFIDMIVPDLDAVISLI